MNDPMAQLLALIAGSQPVGGMQAAAPSMSPSPTSEHRPPYQPPVVATPNPTGGKDTAPGNHLSPYQKKVNAATVHGPRKYTPAMRQNLGMGNPTVGYGDPMRDNTSGYTKLMNLFASAAPVQQVQPQAQQPILQPPGNRPMETY